MPEGWSTLAALCNVLQCRSMRMLHIEQLVQSRERTLPSVAWGTFTYAPNRKLDLDMALRCWAHTLPRNANAVRAIADTALGLGFHTDVCHETPSDSASETPLGDQSPPASRQAPQDQQQNNRPVQYPRPNNNFQRPSRPGRPLPDSSSSDRGFEQQQSPGTSPQFRSSQGPGGQQNSGGQYYGNWRDPVSDPRHAGPTRWSSPSNQAPVRQHPGSYPNSGPEGDRRPQQPWSNPGQQHGNAQRPDRAWQPPQSQQIPPQFQQGSPQYQQRPQPPQFQQGSPQYQQRPQQSGNWSPPSDRVSAPNNVPAPPQQRQNFDRPDFQRGQFQRRPRGDFPPRQGPQNFDRPYPPQPSFQRGPQAGSAEQQIPDMDLEHGEEQSGPVRRRKAAFGKRITPSSSQQEQAGFTPRGRGSANRAQGPPASLQDLEDADRAGNARNEELEVFPQDIHGRNATAVWGVPAAWRDEIEDDEVSNIAAMLHLSLSVWWRCVLRDC